jgi:hypothetical protein
LGFSFSFFFIFCTNDDNDNEEMLFFLIITDYNASRRIPKRCSLARSRHAQLYEYIFLLYIFIYIRLFVFFRASCWLKKGLRAQKWESIYLLLLSKNVVVVESMANAD